MNYNWYHADWQKLTTQRVRQIVTIGLPEIILPEHVAAFGILPLVNTPQPEITNLQLVEDDGFAVTATEATQKWVIVNKFVTVEEEQTYLAQVQADLATLALSEEIAELKGALQAALVWQFRMIEALWETGVTKGLWAATDIANAELKQKYIDWKTKLARLTELGE